MDVGEEIKKEIQNKETGKKIIVSKEIAEKEEKIAEAVSEIPVAEDEIEKRKKKLLRTIKKPKIWVGFFLIVALILGVYIRSLPMTDHNPSVPGIQPGLWDITTNDWTLGPDLDPWLFLRTAKSIVYEGGIPEIDTMRNVPLGFKTAKETRLLPYMIAYTYYISKLFYEKVNVEFAGALLPVIMFAFTILAFFFFVREVFIGEGRKKEKTKANIIAIISTFFMVVIPVFLSRTVAGIPEKESAGFCFMFLSFYLFLKAWRSEKKKSLVFGILAGISTALMGLIWGGVLYVYITIGSSVFLAFLLNNIRKKEFLIYSSWFWVSVIINLIFSERTTLKGMLTSLSSGLAFFVFMVLAIHFILWHTKLSGKIKIRKIPKNIFSLIITIILIIISASILFGPEFIFEKIKVIHQTIFKPVTGRWNTTVAENRQPYFSEWEKSFGPFIKGMAVMLWMFLIGSVVFVRKSLSKIKRKEANFLTLGFVLILIGMIFTRYSSDSLFNGENFISKAVYYLSILLFFWMLYKFYYQSKEYKNPNNGFKKIDFGSIFILVLLLLGIFSARGAVRTIMVLGPIAPIFASYLAVESVYSFKKADDESKKMFLGIAAVLIVALCLFTFSSYYKTIKIQSYYNIPNHYNQQWQKAMAWVRTNTSEDAVFAHWWDYGYWIQSIGNRATVLDGGNAISFWNYYMGRLVLTGDNEKDALEFLYSHDADYLLIDSTDIGKYGAFSSIGSDENYDRFSWIPVFASNPKNTRETSKGMIRVYQGGAGIDEDIVYDNNGTEIFLPQGKAAIIGIIIETENTNNNSVRFKQPKAVFLYNNQQFQIPLRYLEFKNNFADFGTGLNATAKIIQRIVQKNGGVQVDEQGSIIYISPRVMRGFFAQKYLLNDPFNNFPHFKLEYQEDSLIIENLRAQGLNLEEFVHYSGIQGPIKIWKINYTGNETIKQEYLDTDASKYLSWKL